MEEDEARRFVKKGKPPKADEKIRRKREAEVFTWLRERKVKGRLDDGGERRRG